jgi:RNA polymerase sigma-70 factor (ECF subfamily)
VPHDLLALLSSSGPQLHALLTRLTLRPDKADELMQDLFLKLSHSAPFHRAKNPAAYAFRTAIHLAIDSRRRHPKSFAPLPPNLLSATAPPFESVHRAEQAQRVLSALAGLSPLAREAAVLHFIQQLPYEEIARQMGNTPHQVRALCHDALRQLRTKFNVAISKELSHD